MADIAEMIEAFRQLSELETAEIKQQFWGSNTQARDYDIYSFSMASAQTDKLWAVDGYFLYAWTDGTLDGVSVKPNSKGHPAIPLEEFGYESAVGFDRVYLSWGAQTGKTLYLFVGRRKGTHLSQVGKNAHGGGGSGGADNRTAWTHGHDTVSSAGTAEQMPALVIPNGFKVVIRPLNTNTGLIFLGNSKANCEDTDKRIELDFGDSVAFYVTNLNLIWIDAEVTGEGVWYAVET